MRRFYKVLPAKLGSTFLFMKSKFSLNFSATWNDMQLNETSLFPFAGYVNCEW